ncbi:MAG: CinA family protein [Acholeplasmataceae bacterium]
MNDIIKYLKDHTLTISLAESMTGGSLAYEFVKIAGVSEVFKGSLVCYQNDIKVNVLKVPQDLIDTCGVVSQEVVLDMAKKALALFQSDVSLSVTGYAEANKDIFISCKTQSAHIVKHLIFDMGDRLEIIKKTVQAMIKLCKETLID